ncbi:MAG: GHKL domain-containing protein [Epsilonproteobacteria bacterium]|nr:GHKL domain-containing protein [Campylobacterota bacterium]
MQIPQNSQELLCNLEHLINQTYEVEKEFKELKEILNGVIEFLPQALWVVDKDNNIIIQNSKAKTLQHIINSKNDEIEINNKVYLIQKSTLEDKTIIVATDITEQKRNQRLISMGQMAAHLAHEIRNPIGSISILLSILNKKCNQNDIINDIKQAIFRVERIIKSTLLFSKGIKIKPKKFLISDFQKEIQEAITYYSRTKNIEFVYFLPEIEIVGDFDLLLLVLQNMVFNAIDAIEYDENDEGVVEVLYQNDENYHIFNIYDSGIEIENKDILFEAFKTTKTKGNGLGLALSLQIIKAHNGEIALTTQKKGFSIKIPKHLK